MISLILRMNRQNHSNYKFKEIINKNKENEQEKENRNFKKNINTELSLNKIVGLESVKEELRYYLDFIRNRDKYKKWNVKIYYTIFAVAFIQNQIYNKKTVILLIMIYTNAIITPLLF
jgi:hypothetical protein